MERFFCFGKTDFCDSELCSPICEFCDDSGGLEWNQLEIVFESIFGEGYDLSRLRELAQADREGRCIIAPVKPGEIAWGGHARFDPVLGETKNVIYPVILKGWWTGLKDYEYEPREFRFGDLYESYDAAEKALEGEKHG